MDEVTEVWEVIVCAVEMVRSGDVLLNSDFEMIGAVTYVHINEAAVTLDLTNGGGDAHLAFDRETVVLISRRKP